MFNHPGHLLCWVATVLAVAPPVLGAVSFRKDVAPVLVQKCVACHGSEKPKGRYRVDTFAMVMKAGASESPSVVPGDARKSELYRLITSNDPDERMPQKDEALPAGQVEVIKRWIEEGAKFDGEDVSASLATMVAQSTAYPKAPEVYERPVAAAGMAFSPDGKQIAVGGYHEVTVWDAETGTLMGRIGTLPQQVQALAYSPDGGLLVAAGGTPGKGGEVKLLDPVKKSEVRSLVRTADMVFAAAFSPDGAKLACGGSDHAIRIFDVATGKQETVIEQHADWVMGLAYSDDGKYLASASRDKSARVYDAGTGAMVHGYQGHSEAVFGVAFSSDAKRVFSAGRDRKVQVWKSRVGEKAEAQVGGAEEDVLRVARVGEWVITTSADRKVRQYRASDRELVRTLEGHADWVYGVAGHEGSGRLATGGFDGEVRVWDLAGGTLIRSFVAAPGWAGARQQ